MHGASHQPVTFQVARATHLISKVPGSETGERSLLLLLLRSSGDERADEIRRETLRSYSEGIARAAGWQDDDADGEQIMLRAQIALAAALGIVVLLSSTGLEPLTSASSEELSLPLGDLLTAVLSPSGNARPWAVPPTGRQYRRSAAKERPI